MPEKLSNSIDPLWNKIHKTGWGKYPSENLVRFLCRYKKDAKRFNNKNIILDSGCGGGANTKVMVAEGYKVYALDGSAEGVAAASKLTKCLKVVYKVGDFLDIDNFFLPGYFDIICDVVAVYANKIDDIKNIFEKIHKLLKKGGIFYSTCFTTKTTGFGEGVELEKSTFTDMRVGSLKGRGVAHFFTEKEVEELYGRYFKIISIDRISYTENNGSNFIDTFCIISKKR